MDCFLDAFRCEITLRLRNFAFREAFPVRYLELSLSERVLLGLVDFVGALDIGGLNLYFLLPRSLLLLLHAALHDTGLEISRAPLLAFGGIPCCLGEVCLVACHGEVVLTTERLTGFHRLVLLTD